jgi:hypothetical protein
MKIVRLWPLFIFGLCGSAVVACTSGGSEASPSGSVGMRTPKGGFTTTAKPDSRPVVESAPYWCDLIPKEALGRIMDIKGDLSEFRSSDNSIDRAVCGVKDEGKYGPLGVTWDLTDGRKLIASSLDQAASDHPQELPASLGSGFTVYSPATSRIPYEVAALFRCGSREPWIYIAVRSISQGRNATKDLTDLMRIAQRRFGQLHKCTPKPL